jgi:hypothetical protein
MPTARIAFLKPKENLMSLLSIAKDLNVSAADKLAKLDLEALALQSPDPTVEDHEIIFMDSLGRRHGVTLQLAGTTWEEVTVRAVRPRMDRIEGTAFKVAYPLVQYHDLKGRSTAEKVREVVAQIEASNVFVVRDDLYRGIIADHRFKPIVEHLLENFDGEVVFKSSSKMSAIDTLQIVSGDTIQVTAVLDRRRIEVSYPTIAGAERQLVYTSVIQFQNNIGPDTGNRCVPATDAGPRL